MNRTFFLVFIVVLTTNSLIAQDHSNSVKKVDQIGQLRKEFSNSSYHDLFKSFPGLDSIGLEFQGKHVGFATLYFHPESTGKQREYAESFDLAFKGDKNALKNRIGSDLPLLPEDEVEYMDSLRQSEDYLQLSAMVYRDTVNYRFLPPQSSRASYIGKVQQLEELLEQEYKKRKEVVGDSVVIFQGIVGRDGVMGDVGLIEGVQSPFSDMILQKLNDLGRSWSPMIKGGRTLRSLVDIYVELHSDKKFTVSVTGRARKLKIKDQDRSSTIYY